MHSRVGLNPCFHLLYFTNNTLPTSTGAGHQWTESTSTGCNQWLSLAKIVLKVPHVGRNRSLVTNTNRCGEGITVSSMVFRQVIMYTPMTPISRWQEDIGKKREAGVSSSCQVIKDMEGIWIDEKAMQAYICTTWTVTVNLTACWELEPLAAFGQAAASPWKARAELLN